MMDIKSRKKGFSLTEVMLAAGILAIGFMLIAAVFPAGIKLTAMATERTIGAVVASEGFAKVGLYGVNTNMLATNEMRPFERSTLSLAMYNHLQSDLVLTDSEIDSMLAAAAKYPTAIVKGKKYCWSALCRNAEDGNVQVTVFVSRIVGLNLEYPYWDWAGGGWTIIDRVKPIRVGVYEAAVNALEFEDPLLEKYINAGSVIVDDFSGDIYRVMERIPDGGTSFDLLILDRDWDNHSRVPGTLSYIWVIPPAITGSRYPCVGVYQELMDL